MTKGVAPMNRTFREYRVTAKSVESDVITSFYLEPTDGAAVPDHKPGQHLVFRLDVDGTSILRNYSVSSGSNNKFVRIGVKREPAPKDNPQLPAGLISNYMHDHVQVGDILTAAGPMGDFMLAEDSQRPVVLFSGGVGLTPMVAMLHQLVHHSDRRVFFIHACENGRVHAFADEVRALANIRPGVTVHFCYRDPAPSDHGYHSQGLIGREQLQSLLPLDDYEFYLCGPSPFMQANWRLLRQLGVPKERIHYEFFGPATVLDPDEKAVVTDSALTAAVSVITQPSIDTPKAKQDDPMTPAVLTGHRVQFLPSGKEVSWSDDCESLLELAEQSGFSPDYNCRAGLCNTCLSGLVSGDVEYFEPPLDDPPAGKLLLCCSKPVGPVVIDLGQASI